MVMPSTVGPSSKISKAFLKSACRAAFHQSMTPFQECKYSRRNFSFTYPFRLRYQHAPSTIIVCAHLIQREIFMHCSESLGTYPSTPARSGLVVYNPRFTHLAYPTASPEPHAKRLYRIHVCSPSCLWYPSCRVGYCCARGALEQRESDAWPCERARPDFSSILS